MQRNLSGIGGTAPQELDLILAKLDRIYERVKDIKRNGLSGITGDTAPGTPATASNAANQMGVLSQMMFQTATQTPGWAGTTTISPALSPTPMGVPLTMQGAAPLGMPMGAAGMNSAGTLPFAFNRPAPFGGFPAGSLGSAGSGGGLIPYLQSGVNSNAYASVARFGADQFSGYLSLQTQATLSGRPDALGNARLGGSVIGGIIAGGAALLSGNPLLVPAAIGAGSQIGGSLVENLFAPGIKSEQRIGDTLPMANLAAGLNGGYGGNRLYIDPRGRVGLRGYQPGAFGDPIFLDGITVPNGLAGPTADLMKSARGLQERIRKMAGKDNLAPTIDEILKSGTRFSEALIGGGRNPFESVGDAPDYIAPENEEMGRKFLNTAIGAGRGGIESRLSLRATIPLAYSLLTPTRRKGKPETLLGRYQRRAYERHLTGGDDVLKNIEGIIASEPETGGNIADILGRFGATKTYQYAQLQVEKDEPDPISLDTLMKTSAGLRSNERTRTLASLKARGSGAAQASALADRMNLIASLPGGRDSLEYAESQAKWRAADSQAFEQANLVAFGIPRARMQGQLDRLDSLPFAPGNRIGLESRLIGMDRQELASVVAFRKRRSAAGQLSEEEEYSLVQREEALKTDAVSRIGRLSLGMEDKLPALAAGRPLSFRGNSFTLAALRASGTPIRLYGSVNGSDSASKDDFIRQLIGDDFNAAPGGGMKGMNSGNGRIEQLLSSILQVLMSGNGRATGQKADANKNVPPQNRLYDTGAN